MFEAGEECSQVYFLSAGLILEHPGPNNEFRVAFWFGIYGFTLLVLGVSGFGAGGLGPRKTKDLLVHHLPEV